jgi:hypothetical protein
MANNMANSGSTYRYRDEAKRKACLHGQASREEMEEAFGAPFRRAGVAL